MLTQDGDPKGFLVFKTDLSDEYADFGIVNSLELKTLCLINLKQNKGQGFGTALVDRAKKEARLLGASGIHLTLSEASMMLGFYENADFKIQYSWLGKFQPGKSERLLYWQNLAGKQ